MAFEYTVADFMAPIRADVKTKWDQTYGPGEFHLSRKEPFTGIDVPLNFVRESRVTVLVPGTHYRKIGKVVGIVNTMSCPLTYGDPSCYTIQMPNAEVLTVPRALVLSPAGAERQRKSTAQAMAEWAETEWKRFLRDSDVVKNMTTVTVSVNHDDAKKAAKEKPKKSRLRRVLGLLDDASESIRFGENRSVELVRRIVKERKKDPKFLFFVAWRQL